MSIIPAKWQCNHCDAVEDYSVTGHPTSGWSEVTIHIHRGERIKHYCPDCTSELLGPGLVECNEKEWWDYG